MSPPIPASGEQIELTLGEQVAVVTEVGAGLRRYSAAGRELIAGYGPDEPSPFGRGQLLIPWPNRTEDGLYEFEGVRHQLPLNQVAERNAIHGLLRWQRWEATEREPHRVVMEQLLLPQPGYPFSLALAVEYALSEAGLRVAMTARNEGSEPCPYGMGAHPYLRLDSASVDPLLLRLPAQTVLHSDERGIPTDRTMVDGTDFDFRRERPIGETVLDHCFTDLERGEDGLAHAVLRSPDGAAVTLWADERFPYLMVFTGDPLPEAGRRSLAIEPMTCPPNAFRSGEALIRLEPGDCFSGAWGISS